MLYLAVLHKDQFKILALLLDTVSMVTLDYRECTVKCKLYINYINCLSLHISIQKHILTIYLDFDEMTNLIGNGKQSPDKIQSTSLFTDKTLELYLAVQFALRKCEFGRP